MAHLDEMNATLHLALKSLGHSQGVLIVLDGPNQLSYSMKTHISNQELANYLDMVSRSLRGQQTPMKPHLVKDEETKE